MTFYVKPTNRPLALEGWFEKPENRLFGHVRVNANSAIFQLYYGENKLITNEMMMRFALF